MALREYPLQISKVRLERSQFASATREKRKLIILLGHMSNELHVFNKILLATLDGLNGSHTKVEDYVQAGQSFVLIRDIVGKLHEARCAFQICAMSKPTIKGELEKELSKRGWKQIRRLNKLFDDGVMSDIRNGFAFHYRDDDDYVLDAFDSMSESEELVTFLSLQIGNSFHHFSELIVQTALLKRACPQFIDEPYSNWLSRSFRRLAKLVLTCLDQTLSLFNEVMAIIFNPFLANESIESDYVTAFERSEVRLPFFVVSSGEVAPE